MDDRQFLHSDVSRILGITPRQVMAWSERGLVVPFREASGAGTKRVYNYINLIEFSLCDLLFITGYGIQKIKNLLNYLRTCRLMEQWANNFKEYHEELFRRNKEHLQSLIDNEKDGNNKESLIEFSKKEFQKVPLPDKDVGILLIAEGEVYIIPADMCTATNYMMVREIFNKSMEVHVFDIGRLKAIVDKKLK